MVELYLFCAPLFFLGGLVILGLAAAMHRSVRRRRSRATVRADARVVERLAHIHKPGSRPASLFLYEFPVGGIPRRARFAGTSHTRVGDTVSVFYDPDHPERIYIPEAQRWLGIAALYFIGGVWAFLGAMLFIYGLLGIK